MKNRPNLLKIIYFSVPVLICTGHAAAENNDLSTLSDQMETITKNLDYVWVLAMAALVFIMQAGFMCLEAGLAQAKHSINVSIKNMADFILASIGFWIVGFGLMFGISVNGLFGSSDFLINTDDTWRTLFFVFQVVFAGTAATIDSGAVAGRTKFSAYLITSFMVSTLIYPVFGHWAWGSFLHGETKGWLEARGFLDFAGSSVVHSVGGWVALAGVIVIGPRIGKFNEDGTANAIQPHSMTMAYMGTFILIFGWFGFNCGSTLAATPDIAAIALNTLLAACFGCISSSTLSWMNSPFKRPQGEMIANGILGGLVGITAGCAFVDTISAALIGLIAGVIIYYVLGLIENKLRLDDVVGAVAVHGICGAWGTVAVGIFITPQKLEQLGMGRFDQIKIQCLGVAVCFLWAFTVSFIFLKIYNAVFGLRVSEEDEMMGLNISEHGASSSILELADSMIKATSAETIDDSLKVEAEFGTEVGDLATCFNRMIDSVKHEQQLSRKALSQLEEQRRHSDLELAKFHGFLKENVGEVNRETETIAQMLKQSAEKSENMSKSVAMIVEKVELLLSSLSHVSIKTGQATEIVADAVSRSEHGKELIERLNTSALEIGHIVSDIRHIASQTNILALNANIEASRAGEAGKGFKVVADEVKELAKQSSESTVVIEGQVKGIQNGTVTAIESINAIAQIIDQIREINTRISRTVEEEEQSFNSLLDVIHSSSTSASEMQSQMNEAMGVVDGIARKNQDAYSKLELLFKKNKGSLTDN